MIFVVGGDNTKTGPIRVFSWHPAARVFSFAIFTTCFLFALFWPSEYSALPCVILYPSSCETQYMECNNALLTVTLMY